MGYQKYTREMLEEAVSHSTSYAGVLRHLGIKAGGGATANIVRRIKNLEIDHSHFKRSAALQPSNKWKTAKDILGQLPEGSAKVKSAFLRRALEELGVPEQCNRCGLDNQ